jgi:DNA-directed RNA polymerase subunit RPC12/RpoP
MATILTKPAADLVPPGEPTPGQMADSVENRGARWRLALDSAWHCKIDEVVALSKALCGLGSVDGDSPASQGDRALGRLETRTERAFDELAAIEDAAARIDGGTYGLCASCGQAMSDDWLADQPEVLDCPDCSLRQLSLG